MVLLESLLLLLVILFLLPIWWQWSCAKYWRDKGVSYIPGWPLIGAFRRAVVFKKSVSEIFLDLYNDPATKTDPISGFFFLHKACLIIREPTLLKRILLKEFNNFPNRHVFTDPQSDEIGVNTMPLAKGDTWRNIRSNISPVFTGVKMKNFFSLLKEVCEVFEQKLASDAVTGNVEFDVKDLFGLLTVDMLAICAFGVNANSLNNRKSDFYVQAKKMTDFTWKRALEFCGCFFFPELAAICKFTIFPVSTNKFMRDTINHVMAEREKSGAKRNDLIDILITMKNNQSDIFHGDVLVAQAAVFLAAGYETTASATSFALYELAKYPDFQEKLRKEIREEVKNFGEISFERINQLEYLNVVVLETLRMYPTLPFLDRVCSPTDGESYSLEPYHSFKIPKGMPVYIPTSAFHYDPKYYPDPMTFNPERFRDNTKDSVNQYLFLAFGQGPRGCIGARFGMLQVKLAIISVLKDYRVECCETTPKVIKISKKSLVLQSEEPINLVFKKL